MSFFLGVRRTLFPVYLSGCILSIVMGIAARLIYRRQRNSRLLLCMLYFMIVCGYILSIGISLLGPDSLPAVTFNVMLVALPLFICDVPWRVDVMLAFVLLLFLALSRAFKPSAIFFIDLMDSIAFFVVAVCANTNSQYQHFADFNNRHSIKVQRDTDPLTGLLTRKAFEVNMDKVLYNDGACGALVALDIDNYRDMAAVRGLPFGDSVISQTGRQLRKYCRMTDYVGRLSGDEFVIFMPGFIDKALVRAKLHEIMESLKSYFAEEMDFSSYTVSVGCAIISSYNAGQSYEELFSRMEHALYIAKNSGRDKCCFYGE